MKKAKILITEDEPALLYAYTRMLKSPDYEVLSAASGEECLRLAREERPDLVLLDVMLPGVGGVEVCQRLKADPLTSRTFVILISGLRTAPEEQAAALEFGADGYLTKPVAERTLVAHARAMLRIKQAEQELRESEERHRLMAAELKEANRRLEEYNRLKTEFVANMSHELRTPLNAIIGFAQLAGMAAGDRPVPPSYAEAMQRILRNSRHLLSLIDDVLDIAKLEAGRIRIHREHFDVAELVQNAFGELQSLAEAKGVGYTLHVADKLPLAFSDPTRVRQIIINLLSNAIKFTPQGAVSLEVKLAGGQERELAGSGQPRTPAQHFQVIVRDTGVGIDRQSLGFIFERFRQVDGSMTRRVGGTGLGLAIVRQVAALLGGRVEVASEPGVGSTFTATLPFVAPDANAEGGVTAQLSAALADAFSHADGQPEGADDADLPLVLVVEDEEDAATLLTETIRRARYRVRRARNSAEGLRLARELQPAALTLDVMMPGMDGWRVLQALKSDPRTADIPVIVCSIVDNRPLGYHLGASDYAVKPVEPGALVAKLNRLCAEGDGAGYVLVVDDEHGIRELLANALKHGGFEVRTASSGETALKLAAQVTPRAVLCDLMMPGGMTGFEFIARLRAAPATAHTPVIVITGKDLTDEDRRLISGQIADVIRKGDLLISDIASRLGATLTALGVTPKDGQDTDH